MTPNFREVAISGTFFGALAQIARAVIQVASTVLLARLLLPADFGLTAMVFPIVALATVLQEAGFGAAVIQRSSVSDEELSTMFWLNALVGLALSGLLVALSPLVASFYNEPRVALLTAASASLVLLASLSAQQISLLNREMKHHSLAIIDVASLFVGFGAAIFVALVFRSYWAIWVMSFGSSLSTCVLAWKFTKWRPRRCARFHVIADMLRFGGNITLFNILNYFARNLDNVLLGKFWGETALGLYDRAYKLMLIPLLLVNSPLTRVIVPILSRTRHDVSRYRRIYTSTLQMSLIVTVPMVVVLVTVPDKVVSFLLGQSWLESVPIFRWLGLACFMQLFTVSFGWLFISQGRSFHMMLSGVMNSATACTAIVLGLPWSATGVAAAYAISECVKAPVLVWWVGREGPVGPRDLTRALLPFAIAGVCCFLVVRTLNEYLHTHEFVFLVVTTGSAYLTLLVALATTLSGRECLVHVRQIAGSSLGIVTHRVRRLFQTSQSIDSKST